MNKVILYTIFSFFCGVGIHSLWSFNRPLFAPAIISLVFFCLCIFFGPRKIFVFSWIFFGLGLGFLRFALSLDVQQAHLLDVFVEQKETLVLTARISSEPLRSPEGRLSFFVETEAFVVNTELVSARTKIAIRTYTPLEYNFGDRIRIVGKVESPEPFVTDSGRIFNYPAYLWKEGIYYIMSPDEITYIDSYKPSLRSRLYSVKSHLIENIYAKLPESYAGLLSGVLFGQEQSLNKEHEDLFRRVGLSHIVVLSGYNIAILIIILNSFFSFLPLKIRSLLLLSGIFIFTILVGAGPTVVRAALMGVIMVLGKLFALPYNAGRALLVAGFCMVILHPQVLIFDLSFQFSFLASLGVLYIAPLIESYFLYIPKTLALRESVLMSVSAQISVTPLLAYTMGNFSLLAPLVNMLVLWSIPFLMLSGFFLSLVTFFSEVLSIIFVAPSFLLSGYIFRVSQMFDRISFTNLVIPQFHWSILLLLYTLLISLFLYNIEKNKNKV